jgi:hypothetical protein
VQICEVPWIVRSGEDSEEVNPRAKAGIGCHRVSADRGWRVQETHARRNREGRPPDLIGAVNPWRDRWHESGASGIRHSGFPAAKDLESRTREPRTPEVTWQCGTRKLVGDTWRHIGASAFGIRRLELLVDCAHRNREPPSRDIPIFRRGRCG